MSTENKNTIKEMFLSTIEGVNCEDILNEVYSLGEEDIYTHFVKMGAFSTGCLDDVDVNEFVLRVYSDWFLLNKNSSNKNIPMIKVFNDERFSPVNVSKDMRALNLIKSGNLKEILPITIQYINKLEDRYFIAIQCDKVFGLSFPDCDYKVRLYINLAIGKLIEFAKEFLDRVYSAEFPAILKVLNNDYRCDTIIIYTDYENVSRVVSEIEDMSVENPRLFDGVGEVNMLLGRVNDYIGFGEVEETNSTYLYSRASALSAVFSLAEVEYLRQSLVQEESKMIRRSDGESYTPTEYLEYLIERNAIALVEDKMESIEDKYSREYEILSDIRDNIRSYVNIQNEVENLKRSFTRNTQYVLSIDGVGSSNFDYISILYRMFSGAGNGLMKPASQVAKKDLISSVFFKFKDNVGIYDTREILEEYFREKLSYILSDIIESEVEMLASSQESSVLVNLRWKVVERLKIVLAQIDDGDDEGKVYLDRYIRDLIRILSADELENVGIAIGGKEILMGADVSSELVSLLPGLRDNVDKLTRNMEYIDNMLRYFGINAGNMCLTKNTENIVCKIRSKGKKPIQKPGFFGYERVMW